MKRTKKNNTIIVLIVLLLALSIGYAAFSSTLTINGTATGTGSWDVKFTQATLLAADGTSSADSKYGSASIVTTTNEADTVDVAVNLAYPGDGVLLGVAVTNSGKTAAKLKGFTIEGATTDLIIQAADGGPTQNEVLAANGGTCTATFLVKWADDSNLTDLGTKNFKITYQYEQDPEPVNFTGIPQHIDTNVTN